MIERILGAFLACSLTPSCGLEASVLVAEDFSYPDGPLVQVSGSKWKTHSGTAGQTQVAAGQLLLSQKQSEDVSAPWPAGSIASTNAPALYARFDVSFSALPTGSGTYFAHFKDGAATTGLRCRIFATTNNATPGCFRLGIAAGASEPTSLLPDDLVLNTPYTLVCRLVLSNSLSTLWLDLETAAGVTSTDSTTPKSAVAFAFRQSLLNGSGMGELRVDNLLVATTFEEITDQPAALSLQIAIVPPGQVHLHWGARWDQTYSVWASDSVAGPFWLLSSGLWFSDGAGLFEEDPGVTARFYRLCSP